MIDTALVERVTRSLALMLRHQPEQFDLEVDAHGFAPVEEVLRALTERIGANLERADLAEAIGAGDRQRYEIVGDNIRALYGHSIPVEPGPSTKPPEFLYVGVPRADAERARRFGLRGGRRRHLHLAIEEHDALETGRRAAREYTLIRVRAVEAWEDGVDFYDRRALWLAEEIPTQYLDIGESYSDGTARERFSHGRQDEGRQHEPWRGRARETQPAPVDEGDDEEHGESPRESQEALAEDGPEGAGSEAGPERGFEPGSAPLQASGSSDRALPSGSMGPGSQNERGPGSRRGRRGRRGRGRFEGRGAERPGSWGHAAGQAQREPAAPHETREPTARAGETRQPTASAGGAREPAASAGSSGSEGGPRQGRPDDRGAHGGRADGFPRPDERRRGRVPEEHSRGRAGDEGGRGRWGGTERAPREGGGGAPHGREERLGGRRSHEPETRPAPRIERPASDNPASPPAQPAPIEAPRESAGGGFGSGLFEEERAPRKVPAAPVRKPDPPPPPPPAPREGPEDSSPGFGAGV